MNPFEPSETNESEANPEAFGAEIILPGATSTFVAEIRRALMVRGYSAAYDGVADAYDANLFAAVTSFQRDIGIDADGKIGKETQLKLLGSTFPPKVIHLQSAPVEADNFSNFGDFRIVGWWMANLVFLDLTPFKSFDHVSGLKRGNRLGFYCHRLVHRQLMAAFHNLVARNLSGSIVEYDGCFKVRYKRTKDGKGGEVDWSNHCWGIAIDLNPTFSPLGRRLGQHALQISPSVASCFEDVGFIWGGRRTDQNIDSMHFQFCR